MSIDPSSLDTQNLLVKPTVPLSPHVFSGILDVYVPPPILLSQTTAAPTEIQYPKPVEIPDAPAVMAYVPLAKINRLQGTITDAPSVAELKATYSTPLPEADSPVLIKISDDRKNPDQTEYVMPGVKSALEKPDYLNKARPSENWQKYIAGSVSADYKNAVFTLHLVDSPAEMVKNIHRSFEEKPNAESFEDYFNSVYDEHKIHGTYIWDNTLNPEENRKELFTKFSPELTNGLKDLKISEV
jgi:hypothetical protein